MTTSRILFATVRLEDETRCGIAALARHGRLQHLARRITTLASDLAYLS